MNAIIGPNITLHKDNMTESFKENLNLVNAIPSDISTKKIVDSIASMIVVTTLMSFITIPIVVFFALKYFN